MTEIKAATVLPARRTDIELRTSDGLTLVGELALPAEQERSGAWTFGCEASSACAPALLASRGV